MGRVAGLPNWYDNIGRELVEKYVLQYYQPGVGARSLKYCWRRFCREIGPINYHTFLRYARKSDAIAVLRLP